MNSINQKIYERHFLLNFINEYKTTIKGKIISYEAPDFIVKQGRKKSIGIEITQFFPIGVKHITIQHLFIENAKKLFFDQFKQHVSIHVLFSEDKNMPNLQEFINFIHSETLNSNTILKPIKSNLPEAIESIIISRLPNDNFSYWTICSGKTSSNLFIESIKHTIENKEGKFLSYNKHSFKELWLLVVIDRIKCYNSLNTNNLTKIIAKKSNFNKIFIFDFFDKKIHSKFG